MTALLLRLLPWWRYIAGALLLVAVDARAAADTITGNYSVCHEWREQVIGWQRWWSTVTEAPP